MSSAKRRPFCLSLNLLIYPSHSIPWLLMTWQCKEPGHQAINSHCMDRVYQEYSVFNNSRVNSFIAKPRWQIAIWKVILMHSQILYMRQNDSHFADCTFKCIFSNENCYILIQIWLKFFPEGPVDNTLVVIIGSGNSLAPDNIDRDPLRHWIEQGAVSI